MCVCVRACARRGPHRFIGLSWQMYRSRARKAGGSSEVCIHGCFIGLFSHMHRSLLANVLFARA